METLFACDPECSLDSLTLLEWFTVFVFFIVVYFTLVLLRKWAFSRNTYAETSMKWHLPRFLYVAFIFSLITMPVVWWLFGHVGAKIFGQFILPESALIVYLLWVLGSEKHNHSAKPDSKRVSK